MASKQDIEQAVADQFGQLHAGGAFEELIDEIIDGGSTNFGFANDDDVRNYDPSDAKLFHYARYLLNPSWDVLQFVENLGGYILETDGRSVYHRGGQETGRT